jgi:STE24 endopeptidase
MSAGFAAMGGALLMVALRRLGRRWWAAGAAVVVAFGIAVTTLSPIVIEPLFNSFEPLPRGELRSEVLDLARRAEVDVGEVYVMDASKRTTGANAYVAGLGRTKRVVLYDTLLRDFTRAEVRLVVAHELGHVHHSDVPRGLLWLAIVAPFGMLATARLADRLGPANPDLRARPAALLPAVALALALTVPVLTTISNQLSRAVEARADRFSLELTDEPRALIGFPAAHRGLQRVRSGAAPVGERAARHPPDDDAADRGRGRLQLGAGGAGGPPPHSGRFLIPSRVRHLE